MAGSNLILAAAISPKVLYSGQLADTSEDVLYIVPATDSAIITQGTVTNVSGSAVTVNLSVLRSGQATGTGQHRVLSGYSLAGGAVLSLKDYLGGLCLGPGDFIAAQASAANALDFVISGTEHS